MRRLPRWKKNICLKTRRRWARICASSEAWDAAVEVRGMGLMDACDLRQDIDANKLVLDALGVGLLTNATGPHTLRFLPPLICTCDDVDRLMEKLGKLA